MSDGLKLAYDEAIRAQDELGQALRANYPVGAEVHWCWSDRLYAGQVVMHCYGDRIKVRNFLTGKERFISSYSILEAERLLKKETGS